MRVKTKIITLLIFIAYFSVFLTSVVSYVAGRSIINERIQSELAFASETILEDINSLIYDRYNDMQLLINNTILSNPNASPEEIAQVLQSTLIRLGWYDNLYFAALDGEIISSTNRSITLQNVAEESWFQEAQRSFIHVSDALVSPFGDKSVLMFANTVVDSKGNPIGIVFAEFSMELISDFLKGTPQEFEIFLMNESGEVIATKADLSRPNPYSSTPEEEIQDKDFIIEQIVSEGYLAFDGNAWTILVQIPKHIAYEPLKRFAIYLWLTVVVISLEVIFVGNLTAKRFVRPILALSEGVSKMAEGDLHQEINIENKDEIGSLAKNFNTMTHTLAEKTSDLLEEKGKYRSILESSNDAVILFDPMNQVTAFNTKFTEIFKIQPKMGDEAKQTFAFLSQLKSSSSADSTQTMLAIIETSDFQKSMNLEITLSQEENFKILKTYTKPVNDNEGGLVGRIWVFSDITEEREAENSRDEFIQIASHKLRTPLTAINWTIQLLTEDEALQMNESLKSGFQDIMINADRLNTLTKILLDSAEIKQNKIQIHPKPVSFSKIIQSVKKRINPRFPDASKVLIKYPSSSETDPLIVLADADKVAQVLFILLENACVYGRLNEFNSVEVLIESKPEEGSMCLCVRDTGIGIPAEEKRKVFGKFFRGSNAKLNYTEGTGLSLFLARIIMESAGQKIWFNSIENHGSEFCFTLPLASEESHPNHDQNHAQALPAVDPLSKEEITGNSDEDSGQRNPE